MTQIVDSLKVIYWFSPMKVEFPEARIYEETLNCLLYENRIGPDQELMQATSLRVPAGPSYTSDDEDDLRTTLRGLKLDRLIQYRTMFKISLFKH